MEKRKRVGIIGGGASGLMAAISASLQGAKVTLFEKKDVIGKKLLVTGNGRCNFSNLNMSEAYYYTDDEYFVKRALELFGVQDTVDFFNSLGVLVKEKNGYLYPLSEQASTIVDAFKVCIKNNNIEVFYNTEIVNINHNSSVFELTDSNNITYKFDRIIVSAGGRAGLLPKEYCSSYDLLKSLGIKYTRLYPALTQLKCTNLNFKGLQGVRSDCKLTVLVEDVPTMEQYGELLFNETGISGIVTFQVSHLALEAIDNKKTVDIIIDLLPGVSEEELTLMCKTKYLLHPEYTVSEFFSGFHNKKLCDEIIAIANLDPNCNIARVDENNLLSSCLIMKALRVNVKGGGDFNKSQVTAGGVSLSNISDSFEYKDIKGLYITGELLNVDGICGGYNLQWAFTSGYLAGKASAME